MELPHDSAIVALAQFDVASVQVVCLRTAVAIARCCDSGDAHPLCCALACPCAVWFSCAVACFKCVDSAVCVICLS